MKTLKLGVFGITINYSLDDFAEIQGASIESEIMDGTEQSEYLRGAVDAIESIILAHFCAGIAVDSPQYLEGIETAMEAIWNHL